MGPALDGGYTLIGLSKPHPELFEDIPWSTPEVYQVTAQRARAISLPVIRVPAWYDVDALPSLRMLEVELRGQPPPCATPQTRGGDAPATRRLLAALRAPLGEHDVVRITLTLARSRQQKTLAFFCNGPI